MKGAARDARVIELLDMVRLPPPCATACRASSPAARSSASTSPWALAAEPSVVLCDEITSALDTVVAQAVIALLKELQRELDLDLDLSYVFISHDLSTVRAICDDVMVMLNGEVVERLPAARLPDGATYPYSQRLFASVPKLDPGWLDSLNAVPGMRRETGQHAGRVPSVDACRRRRSVATAD
jgi:peptide/nickel transport system ATP-binding protein